MHTLVRLISLHSMSTRDVVLPRRLERSRSRLFAAIAAALLRRTRALVGMGLLPGVPPVPPVLWLFLSFLPSGLGKWRSTVLAGVG